MSRPFAAVESFFERILERPAARLFHAHPQPVQLERRIERAMSAMRVVRAGQTWVPSRYRVLLHPSDLEALEATGEDISGTLAEAILVRARSQGHWLLQHPEVSLIASDRVQQGDLEVDAEPLDPSLVAAAAGGLRRVELEGPKAPRAPIPGTGVIPDAAVLPEPPMAPGLPSDAPGRDAWPEAGRAAIPMAEADTPPPVLPAVPVPVPPAVQVGAATSSATPPVVSPPSPAVPAMPAMTIASRTESSAATPGTGVVPPPLLPPPLVGPRATIEVHLPDGTLREVPFDGTVLTVGRGTENDIVVPDERVSRRHGRFSARHGTLVYTDLGSTNGSQVGGVRVREVALGSGDVVRLGRATLTVRPRP
jgi:FhaA, N-terminal domain/FHA domain